MKRISKISALLTAVIMVLSVFAPSALAFGTYGFATRDANPNWPEYEEDVLYGFAANAGGWYKIDLGAEEETNIANDQRWVYAEAFNGSDGYLYGYTDMTFYKADLEGNIIYESMNMLMMNGMSWNPVDGNLYACAAFEGICTIDLATGNLTQVVPESAYSDMSSPRFTIDAYGNAYLLDWSDWELRSYNLETGVMTSIGTPNIIGYPLAMYADHNTGKLYLSTEDQGCFLFEIDPNTAEATVILETPNAYYSLTGVVPQDYTAPEMVPVESIELNETEITIEAYKQFNITATVLPENATFKAFYLESDDESILRVNPDGSVTALKEGEAVIRAIASTDPDVYAECEVTVTAPTMPEYDENVIYGFQGVWNDGRSPGFYRIDIQQGTWTKIENDLGLNAIYTNIYNPDDGLVYGFNRNNIYKYTVEGVLIDKITMPGFASSAEARDVAFDAVSNSFYVVMASDSALSSSTSLYRVDVTTGQTVLCGQFTDVPIHQIAIDGEGTMYGRAYSEATAVFYTIDKNTGEILNEIGDSYLSTSFGQGMYYDLMKEELIFSRYYASGIVGVPNEAALYTIDTETANAALIFDLNAVQLCGPFVILPETYELPEGVPVWSVEFDEETVEMASGEFTNVGYTVFPIDASNKNVTFSTSDSTVAYVDSNNRLMALDEGTAIITITTEDGGYTDTLEVTVTPYEYPEQDGFLHAYAYGHATGGDLEGPVHFDPMSSQDIYSGVIKSDSMIYAQEFCAADGYVYAYNADYEFLRLSTGNVEFSAVEVDQIAYDMSYDKTTGTMYALADDENDVRGLYTVDIETGALTHVCDLNTEYKITSFAINNKGEAYGLEDTEARLYKFSLVTGELQLVVDVRNNNRLIGSMAFDPNNNSHLYFGGIIEGVPGGVFRFTIREDGTAGIETFHNINYNAVWLTGLYFIQEQGDTGVETVDIESITVNEETVEISVGEKYEIGTTVAPEANEDTLYYTSSNPEVVEVSRDGGLVYGISEGEATITITNSKGTVTDTMVITVGEFVMPEYDGTIGAYGRPMVSGAPSEGWYYFDLESGEAALNGNRGHDLYSAEFVQTDGFIYACEVHSYRAVRPTGYWADGGMDQPVTDISILKMSVDGVVVDKLTCNQMVHNMAYDHTTDTMYVVYLENGSGTQGLALGTLDLTTGFVTKISSMERDYYSIAIDNNGTLYSMEMGTGTLYTIDKATGTGTWVAETGLAYVALTSMAFDRTTNELYFGYIGYGMLNSIVTGVYNVDVETGEVELVFDPLMELIGMYIVSYCEDTVVGDVNGDGIIEAEDALLVLRYSLEIQELTEEELACADIDGNGYVDIVDAILILRSALDV